MNFKKVYFFISISLIFLFLQSATFYFNYLFTQKFTIFSNNLIFNIILILMALMIFLVLSKKVLNPLFKSEEKIKNSIKNTLHELNIPTSTIKINVQMLEKSIKDEKDLQRVERIKKANDNLFKLYSNMEYELKKEIEKIDFEEFFLEDILKESLAKFDEIKKDTIIEVDIENIALYSDYNGFIIVMDNLISNAIKYNDKTNSYIKISLNGTILSIFNRGQKIDTKNIMLVFERYFQENSLNKGFGLGLAIIKEFCDKNSISIVIQTLEDGNKIDLNLKNIIKENTNEYNKS